MSSNNEEDKQAQELRHQLKQLEKALEHANLRILNLETMMKAPQEDLQTKIEKKPGNKRPKK